MSRFEKFVMAGCCAAVTMVIFGATIFQSVSRAQDDAARAQEMILRQAAELETLRARVDVLTDINARLEVVLIDGTPYGAALQ